MMLAYLGMAVSAWVGLLAVDPNSSASWVGGAAALTLLTIAIGFNARNQVNQAREIRAVNQARVRDKRECNYQIGVLVEVLDTNHIPMPGKFWTIPDDATLEVHESEIHQRRRRMFGFVHEDEDGWVTSVFLGTVVAVVAVFAVFALALNTLFIQPLRDLQTSRKQDSCVASLTADYFVSINRALQAQASRNHGESMAASDDLGVTAERIRNRVKICSDGAPDSFEPSPSVAIPPPGS